MNRISLVLAIIIVVMLVLGVYIYFDVRNYNCSDFHTWEDAQRKLIEKGYDKYGLDRDKDGIACETLLKIKIRR